MKCGRPGVCRQREGGGQGEKGRDVGAGGREAELPERVDAAVADEDLQAEDDDQVAEDQGDGASGKRACRWRRPPAASAIRASGTSSETAADGGSEIARRSYPRLCRSPRRAGRAA